MSSRIDVQNGVYSSPDVDLNKTNKQANTTDPAEKRFIAESKQEVINSQEQNVLHNYRSFTYNWTLAALPNDYLNNPESLRRAELEFVIIKSGGKGTAGISDNVVAIDRKVKKTTTIQSGDADFETIEVEETVKDYSSKDAVSGFNKNSPGRFDMYIDNVELKNVMTFTKQSNVSMPTSLKFEIIEPYSVNGFIEALFISARSTGYPDYIQANYVLKLEFKGYRDNSDFTEPEIIPNSTRYFPITFTGIEVDISDRGTRYRCSAIPANERMFGEPNTIKKPIKAEGNTVRDIVNSFISNLNIQTEKSFKEANPNLTNEDIDSYAIKFKSFDEQKGWYDDPNHPIAASNFVKIMKDNNLYKMEDPVNSPQPSAYKVEGAANQNPQPTPQEQLQNPSVTKSTPAKSVIQIPENANAHEVLSNIIRDSEYTRELIKKLGKVSNFPDQFGMVDYFSVRIEVTVKSGINPITKKPAQLITYVVSPYKIHYTKLPLFSDALIDESKLKKLSLREYNYIYTGQNYDVLNFRLNFNTLFYEAIPAAMANNNKPAAQTASSNDNGNKVITGGSNLTDPARARQITPPKRPEVVNVQSYGGNAGQPLDDPYSILAKQMHESVVNSKASLIDGKLDILGDPLYLVTGGIGNYNPAPGERRGMTADGEANQLYSQLLITINFRNPIDILPLENGGTMFFDGNRVPFSGVYQVTEVLSTFREGVFKQTLDVLRMPGQILDYSVKPTQISNLVKEVPDNANKVKEASSVQGATSAVPVSETLNRGTPNSNSNFTNASGGLGGSPTSTVAGPVTRADRLSSSAPIGSPIVNDSTSDIRLASNNNSSFAVSNNIDSGTAILRPTVPTVKTNAIAEPLRGNLINAASLNVTTNIFNNKTSLSSLSKGFIDDEVASLVNKSNIGSGIGEGASLSVTDIDQYSPDDILGTVSSSKGLDSKSISSVTGLGNQANSIVSNIKKNVNTFAGNVSDPEGLAANAGLNPSALSGVDKKLQSKLLNQISQLSNSVPNDVDLDQAIASGVAVNYMSSAQIANIPPTAPYSTAQPPISTTDINYIKSITEKRGIKALTNLYATNSVNKISANFVPNDVVNSLLSSPSNAELNPFKHVTGVSNRVDETIFRDKVDTSYKIAGLPQIKDNNFLKSVGNKFGSTALSPSPLDKLVNRLNDPNAPPYTGDDPIIRKRLGLPPLG